MGWAKVIWEMSAQTEYVSKRRITQMIQAKHYSVLACLIALFATATTPASAQQPPSQKSNQATALRTAQNPASEQIEARRQRAMQNPFLKNTCLSFSKPPIDEDA